METRALKERFCRPDPASQDPAATGTACTKRQTSIPAKSAPVLQNLFTVVHNGHDELFAHFDRPIINAYTESVSHPAKDMNRMGMGHSFEMKLLHGAKARKDDPVIEAVEVDDERPSPHIEFQRMTMIPMHEWEVWRMVEHASGLSTFRRLPEEGHFGSRSV